MTTYRSIQKHFMTFEQEEGVGARVRRSVGTMKQRMFSPFLMLDDFYVKHPAGFPDHPHHGQETITYVLNGMVAHEDFTGAKGVLGKGDLQFMTAGKGIVHSEIPVQMESGEACHGLQFWVDLPKDLKWCEPRYRNLRGDKIPVVRPNENLTVKVISGKSYGVDSVRDLAYTPIHMYHYLTNKAGTQWEQEFPKNFNVFMYVMKGKVSVGDQVFPEHTAVFFNTDGDAVKGEFATDDAQFAIMGGQILDQQTMQHGPFVETDRESLMKVFMNYQYGINGFERAKGWQSSIIHGITEKQVRENEAKGLYKLDHERD